MSWRDPSPPKRGSEWETVRSRLTLHELAGKRGRDSARNGACYLLPVLAHSSWAPLRLPGRDLKGWVRSHMPQTSSRLHRPITRAALTINVGAPSPAEWALSHCVIDVSGRARKGSGCALLMLWGWTHYITVQYYPLTASMAHWALHPKKCCKQNQSRKQATQSTFCEQDCHHTVQGQACRVLQARAGAGKIHPHNSNQPWSH